MATVSDLRNSALWAAWGDALGFVTELADAETVKRRAGVSLVSRPIAWKRRIGGRFGIDADILEGAYSDDTQLRLATSRAIRPDGSFSVESFSKIELPVWLSYALGGGRATKAAARKMAQSRATWTSNFFRTTDATYVASGGNGVAMRIQPHVWSSRDPEDPYVLLRDVVRNAVCTHGHPRALVGAAFHAMSLARALSTGELPDPSGLVTIVDALRNLRAIIKADEDIEQLWVDAWERETSSSLEEAIGSTLNEVALDIKTVETLARTGETSAQRIVGELGGLRPAERGSGTKSAVLASTLAWIGQEDPERTIVSIANVLGSDTDTIATMSGALLGAVCHTRPPTEVQDTGVIANEAIRMKSIADGKASNAFAYPDALSFRLPKSVIDYVGRVNGSLALAGLGVLQEVEKPLRSKSEVYCWMQFSFGQRILVRMRQDPVSLNPALLPANNPWTSATGGSRSHTTRSTPSRDDGTRSLFDVSDPVAETRVREPRTSTPEVRARNRAGREPSVEELAQLVVRAGFPSELIGRYVRDLASQGDYGIQNAAAFASLVASAFRSRRGRQPMQSKD